MSTPPHRNGLAASRLVLPAGVGPTLLDAVAALLPTVSRADWQSRFTRELVLDAEGRPLAASAPSHQGLLLRYYRELPAEPPIPFTETVLHVDAHLLVADKPHFLPVTPSGGYVEETLLARLTRRFDRLTLVPLHRIDRGTAGLVLFSTNAASRGAYQALFRDRRISKRYEALAPPLPQIEFPLTRKTRLVEGDHFFRMCEAEGAANTETRIEVIERGSTLWRYALYPVTGKKHQLRVHLAALGAGIEHDDFYPQLQPRNDCDFSRPLQLLAQGLAFTDPLSGEARSFVSQRSLMI